MAILSKKELPFLLNQSIPSLEKLYYIGRKELLKGRCITFVGTRDITIYGRSVISHLLDKFLSRTDIVVVSGLARGVDAYVHHICLERGIKTMAIVPGSILSAIPKSNMDIFKQ
jgi:DNA processing protein